MTIRLLLTLGESGAAGMGDLTHDMPAGYPGSVYAYGKDYLWRWLREPTAQNAIVAPPYSEPQIIEPIQTGVSWCGVFAWLLWQHDGIPTALIPCARTSTHSADWLPGQSCYTYAIRRAQNALAYPGAYLGAVLMEQGINDANNDTQATWSTNWTAIEAQLRIDLGYSGKLLYARQHDTVWTSTTGQGYEARWATLLAQQDGWASALRIKTKKPEGPWMPDGYALHLETMAQIAFARTALADWLAA